MAGLTDAQKVEALEAMLSSGVLEVEYDGKRVRARSYAEIREELERLRGRLGTKSVRVVKAVCDGGFR